MTLTPGDMEQINQIVADSTGPTDALRKAAQEHRPLRQPGPTDDTKKTPGDKPDVRKIEHKTGDRKPDNASGGMEAFAILEPMAKTAFPVEDALRLMRDCFLAGLTSLRLPEDLVGCPPRNPYLFGSLLPEPPKVAFNEISLVTAGEMKLIEAKKVDSPATDKPKLLPGGGLIVPVAPEPEYGRNPYDTPKFWADLRELQRMAVSSSAFQFTKEKKPEPISIGVYMQMLDADKPADYSSLLDRLANDETTKQWV